MVIALVVALIHSRRKDEIIDELESELNNCLELNEVTKIKVFSTDSRKSKRRKRRFNNRLDKNLSRLKKGLP